MKNTEEIVKELAERAAKANGLELDDLTFQRRGRKASLRVIIDKPQGIVSIVDCERMSRDFEALLDLEDPINCGYTLEVSSPGLDRPLKRPSDYAKYVGKLARITVKEKIDNRSFFVGRITKADAESVELVAEGKDGKIFLIQFDNITKARLEVEI